jgi:tetratricopeptide (TPR) repeat protein
MRALRERASSLLGSRPADLPTQASALRDLGWFLWIHLGDSDAAKAEWTRAERLLAGYDGEARPAAPWLKAGLASMADQDLAVGEAARLWAEVLLEISRSRRAPRLAPIPGEDLDRLATWAGARFLEQLRHLAEPFPDAELSRLAGEDLPPLVRASLTQARLGHARRAGDASLLGRLAAEAGCPASYRLSKRFGRFPRLDLGSPFPPETQRGPLPGEPRTALGCRITLRSEDGRGGVRYLETTVGSARGGPALLQLAWQEPAVIWVNGKKVHGPDPEDSPRPMVRVLALTLLPGENRVLLKLPVGASPRDLQLLVAPDRQRSERGEAPRPHRDPAEPAGHAPPRVREALDATYGPLGAFLEVQAALYVGLPDAGREALVRLIAAAPRFSLARLASAQLEESDPLQPPDLARERARPHLSRALALRPAAARARLQLASALRHQDKSKDALVLVDAAPKGDSDAARLLEYARIQLFVDLGWRSLASRRAEALARRQPRWLAAWQLHHRLALGEHAPAAKIAAKALVALDSTSLAWARTLAAQGRLVEAMAELVRISAIAPGLGSSMEPSLLRRMGKDREARDKLARRLAASSWDPERRLALADVLVALREKNAAIKILTEGMAAHPEHGDYRRALLALGEPHPLGAHRVPGEQAIAEYRKAAWSPGAKPVFVLDRSVIKVFPSGGRLLLTHQIVHLRTKEDVHGYAEVRLPPGAEILTLRTMKADGSTREPEEIGGKQSLSLPDVDVGDFIEAEYVTAAPPEAWWRKGGFYGDTFTFRSVAAHFFRSELEVVTDAAQRITWSRLGPAPEPVEKEAGGLRVTRFTAMRMARLEPEVASSSLVGILPSVQAGQGVSWPDYLRQRRELTFGSATASHAVRVIAKQICHGAPSKRARRAFDWVQANIEEQGALHVSAAETATRRSGSRLNLLRALLAECGVSGSEISLAWPRHLEHAAGAIPPITSFSQPLLSVSLPGEGRVHLLPQIQQAPFGYLPPTLQGALSVSLGRPSEPPSRLPETPEADAHHTRLQVVLQRDGAAVISGEDSLHGVLALQMRAAIRSVPEKQLRHALEQGFFGRYFAGATLTMLRFEHASSTSRPLVLRYRLSVPALARAEDKRLSLSGGFFPARAGRQFAALPSRTLPLQLGPVGPRRIICDIEAPSGFHLADEQASVTVMDASGHTRMLKLGASQPLHFATPFGTVKINLTKTAKGARLERFLHVPYRVVPPGDYQAFASIAAAWDRLEIPALTFQR